MTQAPWCRSKYWLCHHLNSRHLRYRPALAPATPTQTHDFPNLQNVHIFLTKQNALPLYLSDWPIKQAIEEFSDDPALIQTIRLISKERAYHTQLRQQLISELTPKTNEKQDTNCLLRAGLYDKFSLKFAFSIDLIDQIIALNLYQSLSSYAQHNTAQTQLIYSQLIKDLSNQITFYTEFLTFAYAPFNLARRNLRRLRLRFMFAAALYRTRQNHQPLLPPRFAITAWQQFEHTISSLLPYRRKTVANKLLYQEQHPFEHPHSIIK